MTCRACSHGQRLEIAENAIHYLITLRWSNTWVIYPVYKVAFYFEKHYILTIKACHDISVTHADEQQFTRSGKSYILEHIRQKQIFSVWTDVTKLEYHCKIPTQDQPEIFRYFQSFSVCSVKLKFV